MLAWVDVFLVDGLKRSFLVGIFSFFFFFLLRHMLKKMSSFGSRENLVAAFYLTVWKWVSICLVKRKMISLFKKIVLLATVFPLHLWLHKRSISKSFSVTKKFFLMNILLKEKFAPSQPLERTRVSQRKKIRGWSIGQLKPNWLSGALIRERK